MAEFIQCAHNLTQSLNVYFCNGSLVQLVPVENHIRVYYNAEKLMRDFTHISHIY